MDAVDIRCNALREQSAYLIEGSERLSWSIRRDQKSAPKYRLEALEVHETKKPKKSFWRGSSNFGRVGRALGRLSEGVPDRALLGSVFLERL